MAQTKGFLEGLSSAGEGLLAVYGTYQSLDYAVNGSGQQAASAQPAPAADNTAMYVGIAGMVAAALLLKLVFK